MTNELVTQVLQLRPAAIVVIVMTLIAYPVMLLKMRKMTIQGEDRSLVRLFVGLSGRSALHLSAAWLKFAFIAAILVLAQPAQKVHVYLLIVLTVLTLLLKIRWSTLLTEVVGSGLLVLGVGVGATLLQYLRQIRRDPAIVAAYWFLSVFLILCAAVVLLREMQEISGERNYFDENGEIE